MVVEVLEFTVLGIEETRLVIFGDYVLVGCNKLNSTTLPIFFL
jgi:hypothetical protein